VAEPAAILAIVAAAAFLRLHDLGGQALWWDEVMSFRQAKLGLADLLAATAEDNYPPLHNLILHAAIALFGSGEAALRLPSALFGILNVLAIHWVGRMLGGPLAGLLAAGLLAVSGFHLWYSGEARMYALLACGATLFAGTSLRFVLTGRWPWAAASLACAVALLYSHVYGGLTWAAVSLGCLAVLARRGARRRVVLFLGLEMLALLAFLPWLLVLFARARAVGEAGFWIPPLTPWGLFQVLVQLAGGPFMLAAVAVGARLCFRGAAPAAARPAIGPEADRLDAVLLLCCWFGLTLVAGIALSLAVRPMLLSRYLIGTLPALLLFAGVGLAPVLSRPRRRLALGGLAIAAMTGLLVYAPRARDDFRGLAEYLHAELRPDDCVVMIPEAAFALGYYLDTAGVPCLLTARRLEDAPLPPVVGRILAVETLDADATQLARLGTVSATLSFGPTRLLEIVPDVERRGE
jgi:uncharacterized membrane protein